jgi:hypothetical protein
MASSIKRGPNGASLCMPYRSLWIVQLSHDNGRDLAAVIRLFALRRAPKRVEKRFDAVGALNRVNDIANLCGFKLGQDEPGQVEVGFGGPGRARQELGVSAVTPDQRGFEVGTNFISRLRNARPKGRGDARSLGTKALHFRDCTRDDPCNRAAPSGMRGANDFGFRVRKQDRRAISGQHADDETGRVCDDSVGFRQCVPGNRPVDRERRRAVYLIQGEDAFVVATQMVRDAAAVFENEVRIVRRTKPAIEAGINAARIATRAREEAMANARQPREVVCFDWVEHG